MSSRHARLRGSRVGLRVLGLFVLAAAAPLLALALLAQQVIDEALARSNAEILAATAKASSLQTLDRLRLARQSLLAATAGAPIGADDEHPLSAAVDMDARGRPVVQRDGPGTARLLAMARGVAAGAQARLLIVPDVAGAPDVVLRQPLEDGGARLGLVARDFLWDGFDELPAGLWMCALDDQGRPLQCSHPGMAERAAHQLAGKTAADGAQDGTRGLFLAADFGAPDWHFVAGFDDDRADAAAQSLRRQLPLAGAAVLLLALLLTMVQLRRTMTPLLALTEGARQIAQRRTGTRLAITSQDEFGELAGAFNHMAVRIEAQFAELETLAAIDREIVDGADLATIGAQIVQQLQRVLPQRAVALAYLPNLDARHLVGIVAAPTLPDTRSYRIAAEPAVLARIGAAPGWLPLDGVLEVPGLGGGAALPLRRRDRCHGFLALGAGPAPDEDAQRQIHELRNRAAIAAGAAERERSLIHAARHDPVTGLLNRHGLDDTLQQALASTGPGAAQLAVLFVDLDRFKSINDSCGHAVGDQALRQAADRLRDCLPEHAQAARPAGDEFVVLLPRAGDGRAATALAQAINDSLAQPMLLGDSLFFVRASIGVALCDDARAAGEAVLRQADQAMYQAKRAGGGRYALFDPQIDRQARRRAWIEADLPLAAERGELRLVYQPRVARDGTIVSVEALLRWRHPEYGECPPGEFIAVAEQSSLIEHVGRWVIEQACSQARAWRDAGIDGLRVAINLSARQIASDLLLHELRSAMARHGLLGADLEVEITESLLVEQTDSTLERLHALRRLGLTIALDDFGTGYSSMSYLRSLPIDVLKIDRAFVRDIGHDHSALAVARAIVALASSLGMRTVAEGVETAQQLEALQELRCDELQGYLFSPPLEAGAIAERLRAAATPEPTLSP